MTKAHRRYALTKMAASWPDDMLPSILALPPIVIVYLSVFLVRVEQVLENKGDRAGRYGGNGVAFPFHCLQSANIIYSLRVLLLASFQSRRCGARPPDAAG
ncbi:uncharacterized protein B0T15DRAFT_521199 [Chaetomium strumarium]|uniref:Uncharacterized protein n=1 Tax=Chaetomium strumarium TaxID=1170767 RepID=A0AAJ0H4H6_9PEZI|nr:hypothetical protein B0T15DRAFT_521199 [Chaetomium strumarium]